MARKEAPLTACMITQQLDIRHFERAPWTYSGKDDAPDWVNELNGQTLPKPQPQPYLVLADHLRDALNTGNAGHLTELVVRVLNMAGLTVKEAYGIIHNQDVQKRWNEVNATYEETQKAPHFHMVVRFEPAKQGELYRSVTNVAKTLGLEPQYIERPKRGRNAYDNMLAYLTHVKYAEKHQYAPESVYTYAGKPYAEIYAARHDVWLEGRAAVKAQAAKVGIDLLEEMILTGQVTKEQVVLTDEMYDIYSRNARRCDDAFRVYGERRTYKTLQALQNGEFKLGVFYIIGDPGAGKTRLAKMFVQSLIDVSEEMSGERWRACQTAASNPMDDYNGEEILLMDDVRGVSMSSSDWLKLLDPYNNSPASARYKNKTPACRVIVITSTKEPIEFFYYCKQMGGGNRSEALDQFLRRIQSLTKVIKADDFMQARVQIASGTPGTKYLADVPNSEGRDGKLKKVELAYRFDFGDTDYSVDEVVSMMVDTVASNHGRELPHGEAESLHGVGHGETENVTSPMSGEESQEVVK